MVEQAVDFQNTVAKDLTFGANSLFEFFQGDLAIINIGVGEPL